MILGLEVQYSERLRKLTACSIPEFIFQAELRSKQD